MDEVIINITEENELVTITITEEFEEINITATESHPGAMIIVSATEPEDPTDGLLWIPLT
jgi:hypothetical protein